MKKVILAMVLTLGALQAENIVHYDKKEVKETVHYDKKEVKKSGISRVNHPNNTIYSKK